MPCARPSIACISRYTTCTAATWRRRSALVGAYRGLGHPCDHRHQQPEQCQNTTKRSESSCPAFWRQKAAGHGLNLQLRIRGDNPALAPPAIPSHMGLQGAHDRPILDRIMHPPRTCHSLPRSQYRTTLAAHEGQNTWLCRRTTTLLFRMYACYEACHLVNAEGLSAVVAATPRRLGRRSLAHDVAWRTTFQYYCDQN
jgi:hypothetical protein